MTEDQCYHNVNYMLELIWLSEVTPAKNCFTANLNLVLVWEDTRLFWNESVSILDRIQLHASLLWIPRIKFFDNQQITERIDEQLPNDMVMVFRKQKIITKFLSFSKKAILYFRLTAIFSSKQKWNCSYEF